VPSSAIWRVLESILGSVLENVLGCVLGSVLRAYLGGCYDMEVGENRVRVFYGTEKREGESLEIYAGGISPSSHDRVSDL
jgi:hypothetical protein